MSEGIKWEMRGGHPPQNVQVVEEGEEAMIIVGGPDWVISPPELGNKKLYIQDRRRMKMKCPVCRVDGPVPVLFLDEDICVSCCETCKQYGWFKNPDKVEDREDEREKDDD